MMSSCKYIIILLFVLASCNSSKKVAYLQDIDYSKGKKTEMYSGITAHEKDVLSIVVSSRNPELVMPFNLPMVTYQMGGGVGTDGGVQKILGYVVDAEGDIDFPLLGKLHVAGLTRLQVSAMVKQRLMEDDLVKDPTVITEFMNFRIAVMGEVVSPGYFRIDDDQITILAAISMAGDLTIYGKRNNVMVIREENGVRTYHKVDLRSGDLFASPAYYLRQNDIVYVTPNRARAGQSAINENKSVGAWLSLASLMASIAVLIFN